LGTRGPLPRKDACGTQDPTSAFGKWLDTSSGVSPPRDPPLVPHSPKLVEGVLGSSRVAKSRKLEGSVPIRLCSHCVCNAPLTNRLRWFNKGVAIMRYPSGWYAPRSGRASLRGILEVARAGGVTRDVAPRRGVVGLVRAGTLLPVGGDKVRIREGSVGQEDEGPLTPWEEACSRGLDTWF
jgi:hypothetical protein